MLKNGQTKSFWLIIISKVKESGKKNKKAKVSLSHSHPTWSIDRFMTAFFKRNNSINKDH